MHKMKLKGGLQKVAGERTLPVNSGTNAAEDAGAVDWKGGACKAKGECELQWNNLAGK